MAITTILNSAKLEETLQKILYEWLTDAIGNDVEKITAKVKQDGGAVDMKTPWCEYVITFANNSPTGAGALGREARYENISTEISIRGKEPDGTEYDLMKIDDKLRDYFKSNNNTKGRIALSKSGLRNAILTGPFPANEKNHYVRRWFLTYRVLVTNGA